MSARPSYVLTAILALAVWLSPVRALAWTVDGVAIGAGSSEVDFATSGGDSTDLQADVTCLAAFVVLVLHDKYELDAATGLCSAVDANTAMCVLPYGSTDVFLTSGRGGDSIVATDSCSTLSGVHWIVSSGDWGDYVEIEGATSEVDGGDGDDVLIGGSGRDFLDGGPGADTLVGASNADILRGGHGPDQFDGGGGADTLVATDGASTDTGSGGPGVDILLRDGGDSVTQ